MHKFKFKELILFILAVVSLSGCNDPGQLENNSDAILASISAQNATFVTEYSDSYLVDLSDKVSATGADGFVISNVRALSTSSECQVQSITQTGFTILADNSKACDYEYEAKLQNNTQVSNQSDTSVSASRMSEPLSDTAITRIAISRELPVDTSSVELSAISATTMVEQLVNINVKEQLLIQTGYNIDAGFTLSNEVALPYSEVIATVDPVTNSISYTPPAAFEGIERILFNYINDTTGDVLLGTLDVVVAHTANQGLEVDQNIQYLTSVPINQLTDINISKYVTELDGDKYALNYLDSFNAAVNAKDILDVFNKTFTFETSKIGEHYIVFGVTDYNGAYAIGSILIRTYDPNSQGQWKGIELNSTWFTPPLTLSEAIVYNIPYNLSIVDSSYNPSVDLALYSYNQAKNGCASFGSLPSVADMTDLYNTDVKVNHDWPIIEKYFADDNGSAKVIDMTTGEISEPVSNVNYLVTCLQSTGYRVQGPTEDVVANAVDQAVVTFSLVDIPEGLPTDNRFILAQPISYEPIAFTTDSATAILSSSSLNTDADGNAQVIITSTKAEDVEVCGEIMSTSEKACFIVKFIADRATARLTSINKYTALEWELNDSTPYPVIGTVKDFYGNSVIGESVLFTVSNDANPSVTLNSSTAITDTDGTATIQMYNSETAKNETTTITALHTNTITVEESSIARNYYWGKWQWSQPLELYVLDNEISETVPQTCSALGDSWRVITMDEWLEWYNASKNKLLPDEFFTTPHNPMAAAFDDMFNGPKAPLNYGLRVNKRWEAKFVLQTKDGLNMVSMEIDNNGISGSVNNKDGNTAQWMWDTWIYPNDNRFLVYSDLMFYYELFETRFPWNLLCVNQL